MGDLAHTLLSEKLRSLVDSRRSGILVVSSRDVTKGIFLRSGQVVFASSTDEKDKLGENLIRLGRISRSEFAAAYQATQQVKRRLGSALVGAGLVTAEELGRLVAHQVQKIVLSLFTWKEGDLVFQEADEPIPADLALDLSTHRLLLEGARIYPEVDRLEKALGRPQRRLRLAAHPPFDYSSIPMSPVERQILNDGADELRISDMLARPSSRVLLVRAVYALLAGGVLEEAAEQPGDEEGIEVIEEDTGTFRLAVAAAEEGPSASRREQVLARYEAMPRATHYEVLAVSPDADAAAITASHQQLSREMDKDVKDFKTDLRLTSVLSTLRLREREAFRILSDTQHRRNYDRWLGSLRGGADKEVSRGAHSKAQRLGKQALAMLENGERDGAIPLLLEAVEADPKDLDCRRLLAVTLAQHRTLFRSAERHFLAALEMEPADVELRYRLATYYKRAGLGKRAIVQLKAVLKAQPQHEGARLEMRSLEKAGLTSV